MSDSDESAESTLPVTTPVLLLTGPEVLPDIVSDTTPGEPNTPVAQPATMSGNPPEAMMAESIYSPPKPTLGGLTRQSAREMVAYTGGKPNATWTDLAEPNDTEWETPNAIRPNGASDKSKNWNFLTQAPMINHSHTMLQFDTTL